MIKEEKECSAGDLQTLQKDSGSKSASQHPFMTLHSPHRRRRRSLTHQLIVSNVYIFF